MARRKANWSEGSVFLVPQSDGLCSLGQVLKLTPDALNSAVCAFYDIRLKPEAGVSADELSADKLISIQFTTPDLLNSGIWALVAQCAPKHLERMTRLPSLERASFVGAHITGSGIMMEFLDAFYGLRAWDDYADPAYFDKLLLTQDKKPSRLILTRIAKARELG
jgi:hypothetical protein